MKTFSLKPADIDKKWWLIDAKDLVVGRLASEIAKILKGKHKPTYTPHLDCGDNIVVINADKIKFTGNKLDNRLFHWHTGYVGGVKTRTMRQILEGEHPERLLKKAVERMLPKNILGREMLKNLRIFVGEEHTHDAQKPQKLDIAAQNPKNTVRSTR